MSFTADPSQTQNLLSGWNNAAQMAYYQSKLSGDNDTLAFQKAQAAVALAGNLSSAYGYAPGGDWYTFGAGGPTIPSPGTPTQSTMNTLGYGGAIPGFTGFNTGQSLAAQQQYFQQAGSNAGLTGMYAMPSQSQYSPGTWVQLDPNGPQAQQYGPQIGYVQPTGQVQRVGLSQAAQMGYQQGMAVTIPYEQFMSLSQAPPTNAPQQTMAATAQWQQLAAQQQTQNLASAAATGNYVNQAPGYLPQQGFAVDGSNFYQQPSSTTQAYMQQAGGDATQAMNDWVRATNSAVNASRSAAGQPPLDYTTNYGYGSYGQSQETLAAQKQAADIANQQAGLSGYYTAPTMYTPGTYVQDPQSGSYYQVQSGGQLAPISALPQGATAVQGSAGIGGTAGQQGQMTTAYQQQVYQQWLDAQKQSLAQWSAQQGAAQNYLTLLGNLRGPADYAKYQQVLGSTPGGMKDLVAAAAGQYIPGGGATTGVAPTPVNLQNFVGSATGQQPGTADTSGQAAMNSLVAPNQMAPQTWNALTPSQQQMLLGTWESQGYTKDDAQALFSQSLPKYATSMPTGGTFKLQ